MPNSPDVRLEAGKLRHPLKIMDLNLSAKDSSGGFDPSKATTFLETWGSVYTLTGRELVAAQQQVSEVTHKITIRYGAGVNSAQAVFFDDRYYEIQAVQDPDGRKKLLVLLCIERNDSRSADGGGLG